MARRRGGAGPASPVCHALSRCDGCYGLCEGWDDGRVAHRGVLRARSGSLILHHGKDVVKDAARQDALAGDAVLHSSQRPEASRAGADDLGRERGVVLGEDHDAGQGVDTHAA